MDYKFTEEQKELKKEIHDFFSQEMRNAPIDFSTKEVLEAQYGSDEGFAFHKQMMRKLAEKGYRTMAWPKEYGGKGASFVDQFIFNEAQGYYNAPGKEGGINLFGPTLLLFGNDEQKERMLPPIANGEVIYCQGWSEPNAGSDLATLEMTAVKDGEHYVLNGQKIWTTGAHRADKIFILARTDPAEKRGKGLSVFVADMDLPGIEVRPIHYMDGNHLYNEVFFTDVRIPECDRIGEENKGWESTRATMNFERSGVGFYAMNRRLFENLLEYVKTTKRGKRYLYEVPSIRQKLAKLYGDIEAGYSLAYKVTWLQEQGNMLFSASTAAESKVIVTELTQRLANFGTEILGLHGQLSYSKWAPLNGFFPLGYQWCMGGTISMGANEIMRSLIAWVGLGLPRFK